MIFFFFFFLLKRGKKRFDSRSLHFIQKFGFSLRHTIPQKVSRSTESEDTMAGFEFISNNYDGPSYAELPMEIILHIMRFLNQSDVLEASLTCRRWLEASLDPQLMSRIQIHFDELQFDDIHNVSSPLNIFNDSFRYYSKIYLNQVDLDQAMNFNFWKRFNEQLTEIVFDTCDLREKTFNSILKQLTNLESLEINNCRELFMSGRLFKNSYDREAICVACANVKYISLKNNRYLSDALFSRIVATMKNIQNLNLSGCHISFHSALFKKFYPEYQWDASESVLTFHYILEFIEFQATHLKCLNFSETLIDGNALTSLAQINGLHLERLRLRSCDQLTNNGISSFVRFQNTLTELDLSLSVRLTDPSVLEICRTLSRLKVLKLRRCRAITDISIKEIRLLKLLECLDISECDAITSDGFTDGIVAEPNPNMFELHVSALNICEMAVIKIAETMKNLRLLDLSFCKNAVTNLAVQMIFKNLTKLRSLNLEFCDMISDAGITGMEMKTQVEKYVQTKLAIDAKQNAKQETESAQFDGQASSSESKNNNDTDYPIEELRRGIRMNDPLNIHHSYHISLRSKAEEDIVNDAKRKKMFLAMGDQPTERDEMNCCQYSINRLKGLRSLNLTSCNRITDVSIKYTFDLIELKTLSLSRCQQISVTGIEYLVTKCPSIETLNLSECHNINDCAVAMMAEHLKRLTFLHIERCSQLTDRSVDAIAINCKRLKFLDVRGCRSMNCEPNLWLEHMRSLQRILLSKPGPYIMSASKPPNAPPLPSSS